MEFLTVFVIVCVGGFVRWAVGWGKSGAKFNVAKFSATAAVTVMVAGTLAVLFNYQDVLTTPDIIACLLAGYGADKFVGDLWDIITKAKGDS